MSNASVPAKTPPNLWVEAYERLPNELRTGLKAANDPRVDILEGVLQAAQQRLREMNDRRWKFKRPGGGEFIVRDAMEKVIKWIDRFKAVGDTVVQYDPTHAALPWAAVRFLLQVAVNDFEIYGALVENIDFICRLIRRHAISEAIYTKYSTPASLALREALVLLYSKVLSYLANAIRYMDPRGRVIRSTFKSPKSFEMQGIESSDTEVDKCFRLVLAEVSIASTDDITRSIRVWENLETPVLQLVQRDAALQRQTKNKEWQEFLTWLSPLDFHDQHRQIRERRLDGSATWVLNHKEVIEWNNSRNSSILLIHGIQGSGKSMIASKLIDWLGNQSKVAYFYCKRNAAEPERQCPEHILRSILRQLVFETNNTHSQIQDSLFQEFQKRQEKAVKDGFHPRSLQPEESFKLIQEVAEADGICLVIDALDEVEEFQRLELVEPLISLARDSQTVVKIIVTSRYDAQITSLLSDSRKIAICPEDNDKDVGLFIRHKIKEKKQSRMGVLGGTPSPGFEEKLYACLKSKTDEMFLWAALQLERLSLMETEADALAALNSLPPGLDATYEEMMARIAASGATSSRIVFRTFRWLFHAKETLTFDTLLCAVASQGIDGTGSVERSSLVRICRNLIIVDEVSDTVRFSHSTVQEFLLSKAEFAAAKAHESIATECMWMCTTDDDLSTLPLQQDGFYRYATLYWPLHLRSAVLDVETSLRGQLRDFLFDENNEPGFSFQFWLEEAQLLSREFEKGNLLRMNYDAAGSISHTPFFAICIFGLHEMLAELEVRDFPWDQRNAKGHTGLYLAASLGHTRVVEFLIAKKADVNAKCGRYGSPLHSACFAGHVDVVSKLLDHGACAKTPGSVFVNALDAAIRGGHETVAKVLAQREISLLDQAGIEVLMTTLGHAGFVKAVRELEQLNRSRQRHLKEKRAEEKRRIERAIELGQVQQLRRLLQSHPNPKDVLPPDAVALAAISGSMEMIELCLGHGLSIEAHGKFGTPLRAASLQGHRAVVEKLLDYGADAADGNALEAASMKGYLSVVQTLLKHRKVASVVSSSTGSQLHFGPAVRTACLHGRLAVLVYLVKEGANLKGLKFEMGVNFINIAAKAGHGKIVRFLGAAGLRRDPVHDHDSASEIHA